MRIYRITNLITGKRYMGQTTRALDARWKQHKQKSSNCVFLLAAIKKYGEENFKIEEIEECFSKEELDSRESFWIQQENTLAPSGYNLQTGGAAPRHSEVTKKKMSDSRKGKHPEWATRASTSEESRARRSETHKRIAKNVWTKDRVEKCREAARARMKGLYDQEDIFYESLAMAERETGCRRSSIQRQLKGSQKKVMGRSQDYIFRRYDIE